MGTHFRGTAAETRALDAYIKLVRGARTVMAGLDRRLAERNLTERQFGILETLYHLGPLPQSDLGTKQFTTGGNITFILDNLERAGLVRRRRGKDDRRVVTVHLTPRGRALIADIFPGHVEAIVQRFRVLEPGEQVELARLMKKLGLGAPGAARDAETGSGGPA